MDATSQKHYQEREHRFSAVDLENLDATVQRSEEFGSEKCSARLMDFSRKGMKLVLPISVRFEESIKLELAFKNSGITYSGLAQIRHIRPNGDQSWLVGCSLEPSVSDEMIAFLASSSGKERRRSPRIQVSGHGTLQRQGETETTDVQLQNISEGGFCLAVPSQHAVGERVKLEIHNWDNQLQTIDAEIRWQVSTRLGFSIGCNFVNLSGFEKLASCVIETRPHKLTFGRIALAVAMLTILLPPLIYLMTNSSESIAKAEVAQSGSVDDDPKPDFVPRRDKSEGTGSTDTPGATDQEISQTTRAVDRPHRPIATPLLEQPSGVRADVGRVEPLDDPFPQFIVRLPTVDSPQVNNGESEEILTEDKNKSKKSLDSVFKNSPMRIWTDNSGQFRIEAAVIKIQGPSVFLRSFDGAIKIVPLERLSTEDLAYLRALASARK